MLDIAHVVNVEGADPSDRARADELFERAGHDMRAEIDPAYKRATWGLRPEDVAGQQAVIADMQGRRAR